jgi:hypothetical protein
MREESKRRSVARTTFASDLIALTEQPNRTLKIWLRVLQLKFRQKEFFPPLVAVDSNLRL